VSFSSPVHVDGLGVSSGGVLESSVGSEDTTSLCVLDANGGGDDSVG